MNVLDAANEVLANAGEPLHYREIVRRILNARLWESHGATPEATVNARLASDIKKHGAASRFQRTGRGVFALREWSMPELVTANQTENSVDPTPSKSGKSLSFTEAAEHVLGKLGDKKPMHYRQITEKALELGLVNTVGKTPEATMYAQILTETKRREKRGDTPRFVMHGKGYVGLRRWMGHGLAFQIEQHNRSVRKKLHARICTLDPAEFESLIGELLAALGFEEVTVTDRSGDGGIDVRGTLVVGDVIRTRMAVQVKRWKANIQSPVVQQVRGSLGTHEQGLIITTSNFSKGACDESERPDAVPVGLMSGETLVRLLVENDIGVTRRTHDLFELTDEGPPQEPKH